MAEERLVAVTDVLLRSLVCLGIFAAGVMVNPGEACATCAAPQFEIMGNGVDDDCDEAADEGASACPDGVAVVPWVLDTSREFRTKTGDSTQPRQLYGNDMDIQWKFLPSQRMQLYTFIFDRFALENNFDFLTIGSQQLTGSAVSQSYILMAGSTALPLRWQTDPSLETTGARFSSMTSTCVSDGSGFIPDIPMYVGVDGTLLHPKDNAFFKFTLPANRTGIINLDHMGTSQDFDIFVKASGSAFGVDCTSGPCGVSGSSTGETVIIPYSSSARTFVVNILAYSGKGRYKLAVSAPKVIYADEIDIGYEDPVLAGSPEDLRGRLVWGQARAAMLSLTDGQYAIRGDAHVYNDISCSSCQDVIFTNRNNISGCAGAVTWNSGWPFSYIEVARPLWRPHATWTVGGQNCWTGRPGAPYDDARQVGIILAHEWGHYDFELDDEYGMSGTVRCGHSIMAGSELFGFVFGPAGTQADTNQNHIVDFCTNLSHGKDPQLGTSPAGGTAAWSKVHSTYSSLTAPSGNMSPDPSQLRRLGEVVHTALTAFYYHF